MTLLRHEANPRNVQRIERETKQVYARGERPSDAVEAEALARKRRIKKYTVKGRYYRGIIEWHVYEYPSLRWIAGPFRGPGNMGRDEALAHARDLSMGRFSVSYAGIRGVFKARGRVLVPSGEIDKPGAPSPKLTVHKDGMVVG